MFDWRHVARRTVASGAAAAGCFTVFSMLWFGIGAEGLWRPLNLIAHTLWRGAPTGGRWHAGAVLLALVVLLLVGVVVMAPFTFLAIGAGLGPAGMAAGGAVYANVLWIFGNYWIWPAFDPLAAHEFSPGVAWAGHMVAGLAGGSVLALTEYSPASIVAMVRQ